MYSSLFILSPVQKDPSLIDVSCCVHLHSFCCVLLGVGAQSLKPVKLLNKQFQTFLLFCDRRSVAQQCWIRLHSSSNIHARTLHMVYKSLRVASFPLCTAAPNIVGNAHHCQRCWQCTPLPTLLAQQCWELAMQPRIKNKSELPVSE